MDIKNGETLSDEMLLGDMVRECLGRLRGEDRDPDVDFVTECLLHAMEAVAALRAENKQLKEELAKIKNVES